jgi:hypothetical protein
MRERGEDQKPQRPGHRAPGPGPAMTHRRQGTESPSVARPAAAAHPRWRFNSTEKRRLANRASRAGGNVPAAVDGRTAFHPENPLRCCVCCWEADEGAWISDIGANPTD